jgi:hypothetical protein
MAGKKQPLESRFWKKVQKGTDCWNWLAHTNNKGYGTFGLNRTMVLAHRLSYELENGPIPKEMCVLHKCDNPRCVKPSHLWLGSKEANNTDMIRKGRDRKAVGMGVANSKLTDDTVRKVRDLYKTGKYTWRSLAKRFGMSHTPIGKIIREETWRHV